MRNHFKYIVAILLLLFVSVSCTSNFEDVSKNPNASDEALPQALLAPALTSVVKANMSRTRSLTNELMQVTVLMGDIEGRIFRYDIRKSVADYLWNNWYVQLTNFKDMYETAQTLYTVESDKTYNTYMGISLICQCWVFSMLTDTYGDIPYTEACQGKKGILTPVFDRQEDIYTDIFAKLEQANELLANGSDLPEDQVICDPLFQGNALKWRKFSNSLYLRLLLRVSGKEEETAAAKIAEILEERPTDYPIMTSNDDSAILRWTGEQPYVSPFYTLRDSDWRTYVLAEFFLDNLNRWNDPRRPKWADTSNGEYAGVPSGYPVGEEVSARSRLPLALKHDPRLGNIMNYAELEFIITEASVKRYISADAETHYKNGVIAALGMWDLTASSAYLDNTAVKWDDGESLDDKMSRIHLQKYYSLFYTDLQQWFECRRTGYPILPKGAGLLNGGELPSRLNYPVYLQTTNRKNYYDAVSSQGEDEISTKVWWQRKDNQ